MEFFPSMKFPVRFREELDNFVCSRHLDSIIPASCAALYKCSKMLSKRFFDLQKTSWPCVRLRLASYRERERDTFIRSHETNDHGSIEL